MLRACAHIQLPLARALNVYISGYATHTFVVCIMRLYMCKRAFDISVHVLPASARKASCPLSTHLHHHHRHHYPTTSATMHKRTCQRTGPRNHTATIQPHGRRPIVRCRFCRAGCVKEVYNGVERAARGSMTPVYTVCV